MARHAPLMSLAVLIGLSGTAGAQVKLEYKFHEGSKSMEKQVTKIHQILNVAGMDIETSSEQTVVVSASVGKRNADGTLPVAHRIESLKAQLDLPGGVNVTFDSANPDAKIDNPQLAVIGDIYKALVGVNYTIVLDPANKVKFVEGTEKLGEKVEKLDPAVVAALKKRLSSDAIKKDFEQDLSNLPTVLARPGEPWEATEVKDIGGDQTMTFRNRYEYQGTVEKNGKTLDKIGVKSTEVTYAMAPDAQSPAKVTKSDLKIDSSDGTILFDREAGEVVESKTSSRIKGDMTLSINGQDLPSKLDLTMEQSSSREKASK